MARISVSYDELREIAARLMATSGAIDADLHRVLADVRRLEADWIGGRTAPLIDALTTADRCRSELIVALQSLSSYLTAASEAYENAEASIAPSFAVSTAPQLPSRSLSDLLAVPDVLSPADIERRWRGPRAGHIVPIGVGEDGRTVGIDLSTAASVLVSGTTGSGKTELLRTLVTSLALSFPPEYVAFVLVDFKGGGAFGELAQLPHTAAVVSALDSGYTRRWLTQAEAAIYRRQAGGSGPQHLVIVVDEFAGLLEEEPEAVDALVSRIARVGRTLGVHVVVGAQSARSIPEALRGSANVRIGFRMVTRQDSVEMLGVPGAELLSNRGEGFLTDPDNGIRRFRAAVPLQPHDTAQVARAAKAASDRGEHPTRVWPSPLPVSLSSAALVPADASAIPIGVVDLPQELEQHVMSWHPLKDGHLLVWGPPASGKTTALHALAQAAARSGFRTLPDADQLQSSARTRHHLGDEHLEPLLRDIRTRASDTDRRPLILLLDDLDETQVNASDAGNPLDRVLRSIKGRLADRVRLAVTSRRVTFGGEDIRHNFGVVIQLAPWQPGPDEAAKSRHSFVTARVPGRGLWRGNEVQLAH